MTNGELYKDIWRAQKLVDRFKKMAVYLEFSISLLPGRGEILSRTNKGFKHMGL